MHRRAKRDRDNFRGLTIYIAGEVLLIADPKSSLATPPSPAEE
jgi:hypothetical protein